jgi:hypothetical protein
MNRNAGLRERKQDRLPLNLAAAGRHSPEHGLKRLGLKRLDPKRPNRDGAEGNTPHL